MVEKQFKIVCTKCGSENVHVDDNRGRGSEDTGSWGNIDIRCRQCDNAQDLDDLRDLLDKENDG